jgi:Protein of unknown function (DUF2927)
MKPSRAPLHRFAAILLVAALASGCALPAPLTSLLPSAKPSSEDPPEKLVRFFEQVVFGNGQSTGFGGTPYIEKWGAALRYTVTGPDADRYRPLVQSQIHRLAQFAGVTVTEALDPGAAELEVRFLPNRSFRVETEDAPCFARWQSRNGWIVQATVTISTAKESHTSGCLAHELMHAFGFAGHSTVFRTVLTPIYSEREPTSADAIAIGVLYDPRLLPLTPKAEAIMLSRPLIIAAFHRSGFAGLAAQPPRD